MPSYTPLQLQELTLTVGELAIAQSGHNHELALSALLSAYATIADHHHCCTATSARVTAALSATLYDVVAARAAAQH